jgi:hypothetical protein
MVSSNTETHPRNKPARGLFDGSVLGSMSEVILAWVRVSGVYVRLMILGMMSTCVPCQRERGVRLQGGCVLI